MSDTKQMDDLSKLETRLQQPTTDSMGRVYNHSPGSKVREIKYSDAPEIRDMALELSDWSNRPILYKLINDGSVIFKRSISGRSLTNGKSIYIVAIKTDVRSLLNVDFAYCIEVTPLFAHLEKSNQYQLLLKQMKRIPERENPSGSLKSYDSFSGFDYEIQNIIEELEKE